MMDEMRRKAKRAMLADLHKEAKRMLKEGGDMKEMQEVSVMAPDKEKLQEGLDMAKDVVEEMPNGEDSDEMEEGQEDALKAAEKMVNALDRDQLEKIKRMLEEKFGSSEEE